MPRAPDFFQHMERDELEQFEAFAREPGCTIKKCVEWLQAHGVVKVSKTSVGRWKKRFDETDRMSYAAELADAIHTASKDSGGVDVAGAVNLQLAQRLQFAIAKGGDRLPVGDLLKLSIAANQLTSSQKRVDDMRQKGREQMAKLKGVAEKRAITPADIEAASKAVFG